jgi:hypothetical protein
MTALQVLFVVTVIVALLWSRVDPRPGWAVAVLAVPWIVHQISDLSLGSFYYGYLYQRAGNPPYRSSWPAPDL